MYGKQYALQSFTDRSNQNTLRELSVENILGTPEKALPRQSSRLTFAKLDKSLRIDPDDIKLEKLIGKGAFGEVWQSRYRGAKVAVKRSLKEDAFEEIEHEASVWANVERHPNVT